MTPARIEALRKIVRDAADPPWVLCRDFEGDHLATIKGERVTAEAIAKHAAAVRVYRATFDTTASTARAPSAPEPPTPDRRGAERRK